MYAMSQMMSTVGGDVALVVVLVMVVVVLVVEVDYFAAVEV